MRQLILILSLILLSCAVSANDPPEFYGPIQSGDILWNIAKRMTSDPTVTRYQMMLALLKANPQAFQIPCNLNSLKVGQRLRKPTLLEIQALTPQQAKEAYTQQTAVWKKHRLTQQPLLCSQDLVEISHTVATTAENASPSTSVSKLGPTALDKTDAITAQTPVKQPQTFPLPTENTLITSTVNEHITPIFSEIITYFSTLTQQILLSQWTLISGIGIILLILLITWIVEKHLQRKTPPREHSFTVLTEQTWPATENITPSFPDSLSTASDSKHASYSQPLVLTDTQDKLRYLRTYLADGEEQARQLLLKTILEKGSPEQQEEGRQLNTIFNKINSLSSNSPQATELENRWQTILHQLLPFPLSKDFSNNQQELFALIDQVFMLLDETLNAQGQLVATYRQRVHNSCLDGQDYQVVSISDEQAEPSNSPPSSAHQTTRYL